MHGIDCRHSGFGWLGTVELTLLLFLDFVFWVSLFPTIYFVPPRTYAVERHTRTHTWTHAARMGIPCLSSSSARPSTTGHTGVLSPPNRSQLPPRPTHARSLCLPGPRNPVRIRGEPRHLATNVLLTLARWIWLNGTGAPSGTFLRALSTSDDATMTCHGTLDIVVPTWTDLMVVRRAASPAERMAP